MGVSTYIPAVTMVDASAVSVLFLPNWEFGDDANLKAFLYDAATGAIIQEITPLVLDIAEQEVSAAVPPPGVPAVARLFRTERLVNEWNPANDEYLDVRDLVDILKRLSWSAQQVEEVLRPHSAMADDIRWQMKPVWSEDGLQLPAAGERADAVLGFDGSGDPVMLPLGTTGGELLEAETAAAALTVLGAYSSAQADAAIAAEVATVTPASLGVYTIAQVDQAISDAQSAIEGSLKGLVDAGVAAAVPALVYGEGKSILSDADLRMVSAAEWGFEIDDSGALFDWNAASDGEAKLPDYAGLRKSTATILNSSEDHRLEIADNGEGNLLPTAGEDLRWIPPGGAATLVHLGGGDWRVFGAVEAE